MGAASGFRPSAAPPHAQRKLGAASGLRPSAAPTSYTAKAGRCFGAPPLRPSAHSAEIQIFREKLHP